MRNFLNGIKRLKSGIEVQFDSTKNIAGPNQIPSTHKPLSWQTQIIWFNPIWLSDSWTSLLLDMDLHFALGILGLTLQSHSSTFGENFLKYHHISKKFRSRPFFFEGSNIFLGKLEVSLWVVWKKVSIWLDPVIHWYRPKWGKFAILLKMTIFVAIKNQLLLVLKEYAAP